MSLSEAKIGTDCVIKEINIQDEKIKIRLMELGLTVDTVVTVHKKSILKKTMLIIFHFSCFTLKENLAREIVVNYV